MRIFEAIERSDSIGVYASERSLGSDWVREEVEHFRNTRDHTEAQRRVLVFRDESLTEEALTRRLRDIPSLRDPLRPPDVSHALRFLTERKIATMRDELTAARTLA